MLKNDALVISVVRQQFHGPRASAGVCVEEEKAERDIEKYGYHGSKEGTPALWYLYTVVNFTIVPEIGRSYPLRCKEKIYWWMGEGEGY